MLTANANTKLNGKVLKRANPSTIQDKFLVGYQGWFTCPGDGEPVGPGHHGWLHWFNHPIPDGGHPNIDLWPDVSSYSPSELFPAPGLKTSSGEQVFLFSSRNPKSVQRHFHWMAEHGIDGAFLQRFASQCDLEAGNKKIMQIRDEVGDHVREAAEKEGRVFAIMYDVSGVAPDRLQRILERDWIHLIHTKGVLDSPNYLKEKGKPVIALRGLGFANAGHTPALIRAVTNYIRNVTPGGAYIMAGTPAHWRTAERDADPNPEFIDVWLNDFDAISPWTVGRYRNEQDIDIFAETQMEGDIELVKKRNEEGKWRKMDYIPVVLPGGSGFNLTEGRWGFNDIQRKGGRFLWKQVFNAKHQGVRIMYGAMWDEYNEGTALMPVVENKRMLPESDKYPFMALDEDGYDLPSDWYMRICGFAAEGLRSERRVYESFPSKELQDYWGSRPKYEDVDPKSGDFISGVSKESEDITTSRDGQSYQDWLVTQKEDKDEPPPPPYSLESDETPETPSQAASMSNTTLPPTQLTSNSPTSPTVIEPLPIRNTPVTETSSRPLTSGPPPINTSSRPLQHVSTEVRPNPAMSGPVHNTHGSHLDYNALPQRFPTSVPSVQSPVESLVHDYEKHRISTQPHEPAQSHSISPPPPLHPAHPAASSKRPQSSLSRPGSHSQSNPRPESQSGYSYPTAWPPPEWNVSGASQHHKTPSHTQQSPYLEQNTGANLTRPHTFTASSHCASVPLRPNASLSVRPGQLTPSSVVSGLVDPNPPMPHQTYGSSSGAPPFHRYDASSYTSGVPSSTSARPFSPTDPNPSPYPSTISSSPYPGTSESPLYPGQAGYTPPISYGQSHMNIPSHAYPPHNPPSGSSTSSFPGGSHHPSQATSYSSFPGQSSPASPPLPIAYDRPHDQDYSSTGDSQGDIQFPQAHSGSYFNIPQPQATLHQSSSYAPSYIGQQSSNSYYNTPLSYQGPTNVSEPGWFPGSSTSSVPPPMPHRPSSHSPYTNPSSSGPSFPTASTGLSSASTGALNLALSAVDKVAGRKTREQLETGVGSLAQSKF